MMHRQWWLAVVLVTGVAAVPRLIGLGWGLPQLYHCDERRIIQSAWSYAVGETSIPSDGVYSPLPAYLSRMAYGITGGRVGSSPAGTARFLRSVSALASLWTPALVLAAAVPLFGWQAGLVATTLIAFAPGAIREAHFATVDSLLTFGLAATLAAGLWIARHPATKLWPLLPLAVGLTVAAKISALPAALSLAVFVPRLSRAGSWRRCATTCLIAAIGFSVLSWNMVANPRQYAFWAGMSGLSRTGVWTPGWTLQFTRPQPLDGTVSLFWMAGPTLWAAAILGIGPMVLRLRAPLTLLVTAAPFLFPLSECFLGHIPFVRAALALLPLAALASGAFLHKCSAHARLRWTTVVVLVAGAALYGLGYARIFTSADTRVQAAKWLQGHWSPGEVVLLDGTDDLATLPGIPAEAQRALHHPGLDLRQAPVREESLSRQNRAFWRLAAWGATNEKLQRVLDALENPYAPPARARGRFLRSQVKAASWLVTTGTEQARYRSHPGLFDEEIAFYNGLAGDLGFSVAATFESPNMNAPFMPRPEGSWFFFDHPSVTILRAARAPTITRQGDISTKSKHSGSSRAPG